MGKKKHGMTGKPCHPASIKGEVIPVIREEPNAVVIKVEVRDSSRLPGGMRLHMN